VTCRRGRSERDVSDRKACGADGLRGFGHRAALVAGGGGDLLGGAGGVTLSAVREEPSKLDSRQARDSHGGVDGAFRGNAHTAVAAVHLQPQWEAPASGVKDAAQRAGALLAIGAHGDRDPVRQRQ
jgi:hypothetical protein